MKADVERWRPSPAPVVVADPAREGLGKRAVKTLLRADPSVLVLVSCDPSSFGRDAALLLDAGLRRSMDRARHVPGYESRRDGRPVHPLNDLA